MKRYDRGQQVITVLAIGAALLACGILPDVGPGGGDVIPGEEDAVTGPDEPSGSMQVARADVARDMSPSVDEMALDELVTGNNAFAFDLYHRLRGEEDNIIYSPYSISLAMAMAFAGARGETEQQMAEALHYYLPQDDLHPAFNALDLALASREEAAASDDDEGRAFQLNIANAMWGQQDYPFREGYLDVVARNYGAGVNLLDFIQAPEDSRVTINDWVEDETEGLIEDLLPRGSITSDTRLVLTNAIYFYGPWLHPFSEEMTQDSPFTLLDGTQVMVPMMYQEEARSLRYAAGDGYQVVELPYEGEDIAMVILLPDEGNFEAFEAGLNAAEFSRIRGAAWGSTEQVMLSMPRFEFESPSISLAGALADMGMPIAFSDQADFSGMVTMEGDPQFSITDVVHKAYIRVDEAGTEAAAATGIVVGVTSMPQYITVSVDRPFIFAIVDMPTGAILFTGRVLDPR
jgi:serpin B